MVSKFIVSEYCATVVVCVPRSLPRERELRAGGAVEKAKEEVWMKII